MKYGNCAAVVKKVICTKQIGLIANLSRLQLNQIRPGNTLIARDDTFQGRKETESITASWPSFSHFSRTEGFPISLADAKCPRSVRICG